MKRNLIMGVSKGYGWWEVEPFVTSWKLNASDAELVLFVDDTSDWTRQVISSSGGGAVHLVAIPEQFRDRQVVNIRWSIYKNFLEQHIGEYEQVLLTDVRDVIFQDDPFEYHRHYKNYFCFATEGNTIGGSEVNTAWVKNFLGEAVFEAIKNRTIICAGTFLASSDALQIFLKEMEDAVSRNYSWGADQANANWLIYSGRLAIENIFESNVEHGTILTLAWGNAGTVGDRIVNRSREIPAVVHMYTNYHDLINLVNRLYRSNTQPSVDNFDDVASLLDASNVALYHAQYQPVFNMLMYLTERYSDSNDWRGMFNRLTKMLRLTLSMSNAPFTVEIIEQTIARALLIAFKEVEIATEQLQSMYQLLEQAKRSRRTVYRPFEQKILFEIAETYRRAGDKDNALEFYKKLLDA